MRCYIVQSRYQPSRMRSNVSLSSVQSQESGVEKDSRSQSSSSLLEKMSQAIAKRKNSDPKAEVDVINDSVGLTIYSRAFGPPRLKADFQSSHEAPRNSLRVLASN